MSVASSPARVPPASIRRPGEPDEDPFAWLKDENWQEVMRDPGRLAPRIRSWLEARNADTARAMAATRPLQAKLLAEFRGRIDEEERSVALPDGPYEYYHRYRRGGQHPLHCRRPRGGGGPEEILLDGDREAEGAGYFRIGAFEPGPDHRFAVWAADRSGSESYALRIRNLGSGEDLPDTLPAAAGPVAWANDGAHFFYSVLDERHRPVKVLLHRLGAPPEEDPLVYEEEDPGFFVSVGLTGSRRFVVIDSHDHTTSEIRLIDAGRPHSPAFLVAERERDVEYHLTHHRERLLILTNAGGAEDFRIVEAPLAAPGRGHWRDLVSHRPGRLILGIEAHGEHLVRLEREEGLPRIVARGLANGEEHALAVDEEAYSLGLVAAREFEGDDLHYTYSSPTTPERTYRHDLRRRERTLVRTQAIPSEHDPADYRSARLFAASHDGERVPITVLHRRDTPIDGSAPLLLHGYGSYGISLPASFGGPRLSLVDRGFVYAIAHVRGGMERGYRWYRDGKGDRKRNTFLDFIAAAEHLVERGYARPDALACLGGSAGGLLVGAVLNLRPDLFRAAVAEVPFVDVLNTMCDDTLPLTPPEWPEWGNPIEDRQAREYIRSYSPYDNVAAGDYPHILATAGLCDPRVTYWEPAKWVARLAATRTDDGLLLLKTNMGAGHAGAAGRFERLEETAFVFAFLLFALGLADLEDPAG